MIFKENVEVKAPHLSTGMTYSLASQGFLPQKKCSPNSIDLGVGRTPEQLRKFYCRQNSHPPDDDHIFHPFPGHFTN